MSASQQLRDAIYKRAKCRCECAVGGCPHHASRCPNSLRGAWQVHRKAGESKYYLLSNCLALCQTCHRNTSFHGTG